MSGTSKKSWTVWVRVAIASIVVLLIAGGMFAFRNTRSKIISKQEALALIDPQIRKSPPDPALGARYKVTREVLDALGHDEAVDVSILGKWAPEAKRIMSMMKGSPYAINELSGTFSGNFEPVEGNKDWGKLSLDLERYLIGYMRAAVQRNQRNDAVEFAKARESIFTLLYRAKGMNLSAALATLKDRNPYSTFRPERLTYIWDISADELQNILNATPPFAVRPDLAHDALARGLEEEFLPKVLDPEKRARELAMTAIPGDIAIDEPATVEMANKVFLAIDSNLTKDYAHRDTTPESKQAELTKDLDPLLAGDPFTSQNSLQATQTRLGLWRHPNAVGKYLVLQELTVLLDFQRALYRDRAQHELCRLTMALDIYSQQNNMAPASLKELVTFKILPAIPNDPYTGQPYRYDPARRIVWSIGEDAVDNHGDFKSDEALRF